MWPGNAFIALGVLVLASFSVYHVQAKRKWDKLEPEINKFYPGGHYIMLTFNDALDSTLTPKLLDILNEKKIRVTLFVQGKDVEANKGLITRARDERHEIANYGWDLESKSTSPADEEIVDQVARTSKAVEEITGKKTSVYRPPSKPSTAFKYTSQHAQLVGTGGPQHASPHQVILHSLNADNNGDATESSAIAETIITKAQKGDVVMCHLTAHSVEAVVRVVDKLTEEGYEFLTLSEVMSFPDDKPH